MTEYAACGACGGVVGDTIAYARSFCDSSPVSFAVCSSCGTFVSQRHDRSALYADRESGNYDASPALLRALKQRFIAAGLRRYSVYRNLRTLDFGCGAGDLANALIVSGWLNVRATDVQSDPPVSLNPAVGYFPLHALVSAGETYDLIFARHVVEHVENLNLTLAAFAAALAPGGRVICEVPNAKSPFRRLMGSRWPGYYAPFHVHVFTSEGLVAAFRRAGFDVTGVRRANSPVVGSWLIQFGWPRLLCKMVSALLYPVQVVWSVVAMQSESFVIEAKRTS